MKSPFLTLIIPVYNVEKYIRASLQSVFEQQTEGVEVFVINDGTPDNSMLIVEEFAKKYSNLYKIIQSNQGLSGARNTGLSKATGDYVWFVDSDDTISGDSLKYIKQQIEYFKADILAFDVLKIEEGSGKQLLDPLCYKEKRKCCYRKVLSRDKTVNVIKEAFVQRFVFRRVFLQQHDLKFFCGIYHEDNEFMPRVLFYAKSVAIVNYASYRYLVRSSGNIMSLKSVKRIQDRLRIVDNLLVFKQQNAHSFVDKCYMSFYIFSMVRGLIKEETSMGEQGAKLIRAKYSFFRKQAWNAIVASFYYKLPKSLLKAIVITVYPAWGKYLEK
jgi:glycosyltransferase involved capsular polysaccharide biosynthesis